MADLHLAVLPGDGVGPEVVRAALDVLDAVAEQAGHRVQTQAWPIGWAGLAEAGAALPDETLLYPGHLYSSDPASTMGDQKATNPFLRVASLDQFLMFMGA